MSSDLDRRGFRSAADSGKFTKAFRAADALLKSGPDQAAVDALYWLPPPKAAPALRALMQRAPSDPWPAWFLCALLSQSGRGSEALALSARFPRLAKRYGWMRARRAEMLLADRRDLDGAGKELEAALAASPACWRFQLSLAEVDALRGDWKGALRRLQSLAVSLPAEDKPWAAAALGKTLLWAGNAREALPFLDLALERVPEALRSRGAARLLLKKWEAAATDLDLFLRKAPADAEALVWRGELRRRRGDERGAEADLDAAVAAPGGNQFWALANRALLRAEQGDETRFWADYRAIRRDVLDAFEAGKPAATFKAAVRALENGLKAGKGLRDAGERFFPVWMRGHGARR